MPLRLPIMLMLLALVAPAGAASLEQRVSVLEQRIGKLTELLMEIDALRRENRELRGQLENQQYMLETLKQRQRDLYLDIDQRLNAIQGGAPATPRSRAAVGTVQSQPAPAAPGKADRAAEEKAYQAAYSLLRPEQRRYAEAIAAFRQFLADYPNGAFADNAQYWLAEANYVTNDMTSALAEFQKVVDGFPQSPKVPGALLKIGKIKRATGDAPAARSFFKRVVQEFPRSSEARLAQQELDRLSGGR